MNNLSNIVPKETIYQIKNGIIKKLKLISSNPIAGTKNHYWYRENGKKIVAINIKDAEYFIIYYG